HLAIQESVDQRAGNQIDSVAAARSAGLLPELRPQPHEVVIERSLVGYGVERGREIRTLDGSGGATRKVGDGLAHDGCEMNPLLVRSDDIHGQISLPDYLRVKLAKPRDQRSGLSFEQPADPGEST